VVFYALLLFQILCINADLFVHNRNMLGQPFDQSLVCVDNQEYVSAGLVVLLLELGDLFDKAFVSGFLLVRPSEKYHIVAVS